MAGKLAPVLVTAVLMLLGFGALMLGLSNLRSGPGVFFTLLGVTAAVGSIIVLVVAGRERYG